MTPTAQAAAGLVDGPGRTVTAVQANLRHSRLADYQELFKVRVTSMVVLTAWAAFYSRLDALRDSQYAMGPVSGTSGDCPGVVRSQRAQPGD